MDLPARSFPAMVAAAATRSQDRAALLLRRGDLMARELEWPEEGAEAWRRSLELDPELGAARARLAALGTPSV